MRPARIAIYGGGGAPYHHAAALARAGHSIDFVYPVDILEGALTGFDALVVPGGGYRAMQGQIDPLGVAGARAIETYVREGGMYIGSCAGSYDAAVVAESFVRACPAQKEMQLLDARVWNENDTEWLGLQSPGVGVLRARTVAPVQSAPCARARSSARASSPSSSRRVTGAGRRTRSCRRRTTRRRCSSSRACSR